MKRLLCMGLLLGVLCGCAPVMQAETVATPLEAALRLEQSLEQGEDTLLLRSEEKLDGEALFQVTEAIWPYAFTMGLTTYGNGLTEISVQVSDKARQEQAVQLAKGLAEQATAGMTAPRDKLRALHDLLVKSCVYDVQTSEQEDAADGAGAPFTAYGALVDGKAVCAGYARAYVLLCRAVGLDAIYVASNEMNHGWNAVRLDGQTYFIDCTFDDPVPDQGEYVTDEYFLLTTDQLRQTHTWNVELYERIMDAKWDENTENPHET